MYGRIMVVMALVVFLASLVVEDQWLEVSGWASRQIVCRVVVCRVVFVYVVVDVSWNGNVYVSSLVLTVVVVVVGIVVAAVISDVVVDLVHVSGVRH